jgi:hypothetical protein
MLRGTGAAVAALLLAATLVVLPAEGGTAAAAPAAKKKCKPKVAYAAKKKRCKKRKTPPIVLPGPAPVVPVTPSVATSRERARVTWAAVNKDIDLHVWDQAGRHTYYALSEIPGGLHGGDVTTAGFETFTDQQWFEPVPSGGNRVLSYGLCLRDTGPVSATISGLLPDGSAFSQTVPGLAQDSGQLVAPANGHMPAPGWCP